MTIAKIRRSLNDSNIGRKVNGSTIGLYVEAISRGLSDIVWEFRFERARNSWRQIEDFVYSLPCEQQDWTKVKYFPVKTVNDKYQDAEQNPTRAYSWTTPFYRIAYGKMERVPTDVVLQRERVD